MMIRYDWNNEKNRLLKETRGVSFEHVVVLIEEGKLLDIIEHPNREQYGHQKILIVNIDGYAYAVPYVVRGNIRFLKTIIPSRKYTKKYLGGRS